MALSLYNAGSRAVERFRFPGRPVRVYVCGITPYDTTHLGHAFTYLVYDVLIRHLEVVHGQTVSYAQNVTDIDDDILRRAGETGEEWRALGQRWTARFVADMRRLNVRPPDAFPAATGAIPAMQHQIAALIEAGRAYVRGGSVYLHAGPEFGRGLTDLARPALLAIANERGNRPDDPAKEDPLDPVLWQAGTPGEPIWRSPWGPGRPGWHVECAAMAATELGLPVDIHGGGGDLAFPHHEAERVIAEAATGIVPFVRFWMHTAMVERDGDKMSKSLGNLVLIDDLLRDEHPDTVRLYLLSHHYRRAWQWDPAGLAATRAWLRTLHGALERTSGHGAVLDPAPIGPRFTAALDNDLDTPAAVAVALQLADDILAMPAQADVAAAQDVLRTLAGRVLGLWLVSRAELEERLPPWPEPTIGAPDTEAASTGPGAVTA